MDKQTIIKQAIDEIGAAYYKATIKIAGKDDLTTYCIRQNIKDGTLPDLISCNTKVMINGKEIALSDANIDEIEVLDNNLNKIKFKDVPDIGEYLISMNTVEILIGNMLTNLINVEIINGKFKYILPNMLC